MKKSILILLAITVALSVYGYRNKIHIKELNEVVALAKKGDVSAMRKAGEMLYSIYLCQMSTTSSVKDDAMDFFRQAGDAGDDACRLFAMANDWHTYQDCKNQNQRDSVEFTILKQAADAGFAPAQYSLSTCYLEHYPYELPSSAGKKSYAEAFVLMKEAADNGAAYACYELSDMYVSLEELYCIRDTIASVRYKKLAASYDYLPKLSADFAAILFEKEQFKAAIDYYDRALAGYKMYSEVDLRYLYLAKGIASLCLNDIESATNALKKSTLIPSYLLKKNQLTSISILSEIGNKLLEMHCYHYYFLVKRLMAENGDAQAQNIVGNIYCNGCLKLVSGNQRKVELLPIKEDAERALYWWGKAAEQKYANAYYNIGVYLFEHASDETDKKRAFDSLKKCEEAGIREADIYLGECAYQGFGCEQDYKIAMKYFISTEDTHTLARLRIGECLYFGNGVEKDLRKAFDYFMKVSETSSVAMNMISRYYRFGVDGVVTKDLERADEWQRRAAATNDNIAEFIKLMAE